MTLPFAQARLALRLARREIRRQPWRSLLVALLVFVPTALMATWVTLLRTGEWSDAEAQLANYGTFDAEATLKTENVHAPTLGPPAPEDLDRLARALPAESSLLAEQTSWDRIRRPSERVHLTFSTLPLDDERVAPMYGRRRGNQRPGPGEVVLLEDAARELDVRVGDVIRPERLNRDLEVVGTVAYRGERYAAEAYVDPGALAAVAASSTFNVHIDVPGTVTDHPELASLREYFGDEFPGAEGWWLTSPPHTAEGQAVLGADLGYSYLTGGIGLAVLAIVIVAAFAIGARRQLRTIGLLAASGAPPTSIRTFLLSQGLLVGGVASVLGVLGGAALPLALPRSWVEATIGHAFDGLRVQPLDLVPVVAIGVLASTVAAWFPARAASSVPVLAALAGRRPQGRVPRRLPVIGVLLIAVGCGLLALVSNTDASADWATLAGLAGSLALLAGAVCVTPWVVSVVEHRSARWPGAPRLAARSLGRARLRSSAVVGAICAVAGVLVVGWTLALSFDDAGYGEPPPDLPKDQLLLYAEDVNGTGARPSQSDIDAELERVEARVEAVVAGAEVVDIRGLQAWGDTGTIPIDLWVPELAYGVELALATPALMDMLGVPSDLRRALAEGKGVVPFRDDEMPRQIEVRTLGSDARPRLTVASFASPTVSYYTGEVLVSEATAERLGLEPAPTSTWVLWYRDGLTSAQRAELRLLADDLTWEASLADAAITPNLQVSDAPDVDPVAFARMVTLGLGLAVTLLVVAIGLGLAAKDSEDERQVLYAVGSSPRTLRRVAAARAVLLVLSATVIAVPAGLAASFAVVEPVEDVALHIEWPSIGFVLLGGPAIAGVVVLVGSWLRERLRPPRAEVFAFVD